MPCCDKHDLEKSAYKNCNNYQKNQSHRSCCNSCCKYKGQRQTKRESAFVSIEYGSPKTSNLMREKRYKPKKKRQQICQTGQQRMNNQMQLCQPEICESCSKPVTYYAFKCCGCGCQCFDSKQHTYVIGPSMTCYGNNEIRDMTVNNLNYTN
nr:uncharacterized protein LOC107455625 [Parasteatoda tepidariorum]